MTDKIIIKAFALDDDNDHRDMITRALEMTEVQHFQVFALPGDFLKALDENVHIAIIDHLLGKETGYEIMMKVLERNPKCYIIIASGFGNEAIMVKYWNNGAHKWVNKNDPHFTEKLIEYVNSAYCFFNTKLNYLKEQHDKIKAMRIVV